MKGIVTVEVRNKDTLELEDVIVKENIITDTFVQRSIKDDGRLDLQISIATSVFAPSFWTYTVPTDARYRDSDIPNVPNTQFFAKTADADAFVQFSARYNPPATGTTRTINTILLSRYDSQTDITPYGLYQDRHQPRAFTKLDVPCIQTDTQVYDIYYRIYFQYDADNSNMNYDIYESFLKRMISPVNTSISGNLAFSRRWHFPFPPVQMRDSDGTKYGVSCAYWDHNYMAYEPVRTLTGFKTDIEFGFESRVGEIIAGAYYTDRDRITAPAQSDYTTKFSKIQNLIGHKVELTTRTSPPFLDVDNLPDSTGRVTLGGEWNDTGTVVDDYYQYVSLPEWNKIQIVESGAVGVSKYKYTTQKFIGLDTHNKLVQGLSASRPKLVPAFTSYNSERMALMGNISDTKFGVKQISATIRYDDSSVLVPHVDSVMLYSISASKYWMLTGGYTNIHQLAVMGGVVYIACRDTGLWRVDPRVSTVATKVTVTTPRTVDFSRCHGVSAGAGVLWAVSNDALVSYNGTTWTVFDSTTTPKFGDDATIYEKIEYIVADTDHADGRLLVIKTAAAAGNNLGWRWSTTKALTVTADLPTGAGHGAPRENRSHVVFMEQGVWVVYRNYAYYLFNFDSGLLTNINAPGTYASSYAHNVLRAPLIVTDPTGRRFLYIANYAGSDWDYGTNSSYRAYLFKYEQNLYDSTGARVANIPFTNSSLYAPNDYFQGTVKGIAGSEHAHHCTLLLAHGIMFSIVKIIRPSNNIECTEAYVAQIGLDATPHGGAMRWVATKEYGWDGSRWVYGATDGKPTHSTQQELLDGITVKFEDGVTGTSFLTPNYWKFGLCRGLLKDNATRARFVTPFYVSKNLSGNAPLSGSVVPATETGSTGVVGVNADKSTAWVKLNANGNVEFAGQNGWQYAVGDKYLVGDFELAIDTSLFTDSLQKDRASVGIGRISRADPRPLLEIWPSNGISIYTTDGGHGGAAWGTRAYHSSTVPTTLSIRRTAGVVTVVANGTVVYTYPTNGYIRAADDKLEVIFNIGGFQVVPIGCISPKATIVSNGSTRALHIGDPVAKTESYRVQFKGVDTTIPPTGTLGGQPVNVKTDGTAPVPGEITLDAYSGILYFNQADVGKTVSLNCTRVYNN